jgi:hypothetical protein
LNHSAAAAPTAWLGTVFAVCLALFGAGTASANDYVVVRGAYYREASTRVIQPLVEVQRESPSGLDVGAHFLVDAITSASIAAGTTVDNVFTEIRDEAGLRIRKRWQRSDLSLFYKYSAESDYWSHNVGASFGKRFWDDTAAIRLTVGRTWDAIAAKPPIQLNCQQGTGMPQNPTSCPLDVWFGGLSYSQVLSPVTIMQVSYETAYLSGYQGNVYRTVPSLNNQVELLPQRRLRNAITPRIAYYFPRSGTGVQLHYRFYFDFFPERPGELNPQKTDSDPWHITAQTIEGRLYQRLSPTLEMRLLFRYHRQSHANFWCDAPRPSRLPPTEFCAVGTNPPAGYLPGAIYYTADPKLGPVETKYPEIQLAWAADALQTVPFLRWFSAGSFEISYGHYFQNTAFGGAHLVQSGYRLAF